MMANIGGIIFIVFNLCRFAVIILCSTHTKIEIVSNVKDLLKESNRETNYEGGSYETVATGD